MAVLAGSAGLTSCSCSILIREAAPAMIEANLPDVYRAYIGCPNKQDWTRLQQLVDDEVVYNGEQFGLEKYRMMLERDFFDIPDLYFNVRLLISEPPHVASQLRLDCRPKGRFLGLPVNGKRVSFTENVWSVIDKAAIEAQL
jgi:predicted ester cyclase